MKLTANEFYSYFRKYYLILEDVKLLIFCAHLVKKLEDQYLTYAKKNKIDSSHYMKCRDQLQSLIESGNGNEYLKMYSQIQDLILDEPIESREEMEKINELILTGHFNSVEEEIRSSHEMVGNSVYGIFNLVYKYIEKKNKDCFVDILECYLSLFTELSRAALEIEIESLVKLLQYIDSSKLSDSELLPNILQCEYGTEIKSIIDNHYDRYKRQKSL